MSAPPPPFQSKHPPTTFYRSVLYAWNGLIHTVVHQRNMRMHIIAGLLVGLVGSGIALGLAEKVILIFCVLLVLFAEMLNSALEQLVDLAIQQFDEKAKLTKDIAAAGVLVLAIGTIVIFAAVLVHNAGTIFSSLDAIERQVMFGVPLTFFGGALMHEQKKPIWLDAIFGLGALGTWLFTTTWTESYVFSAMTLGLLVVCAGAAISRQRSRRAAANAAP
ncbi:MAG: diacylglycerol kinase family protein [Archangium sp.]